eukprot:5045552-Heterocapsa_arctica.AAC.1
MSSVVLQLTANQPGTNLWAEPKFLLRQEIWGFIAHCWAVCGALLAYVHPRHGRTLAALRRVENRAQICNLAENMFWSTA